MASFTIVHMDDFERPFPKWALARKSLGLQSFGMNVVELALIKQILLGPDSTEVKMILTTPFCPYAGAMIAQVKEQAESVVDHEVKVTLLAERWDPRDAGLMW